ncbi:MAG: hypothetical protein ACI8RD_004444 [Bacillariaceae sp.]|jgi:hypothetical protein
MIASTSSNYATLPMINMVKMETVLSATLNDLHIRNEVGECIQSMLLDVETTYHLQHQLELQATQKLLERVQMEQQGIILEAHTERIERYDRRLDVADHFVVELVQLDRDLKELLAWKEEHEYKVRNYDAVLAKLAQTEEELMEANRVSFGGGAKPRRVTMTVKDTDTDNDNDNDNDNNDNIKVEQEKEETTNVATIITQAPPRISDSIPEQTPENTINSTTATTTGSDEILLQSSNDKLESDTERGPKTQIGAQESAVVGENNKEDQKQPAAVVSIDVDADIKEDVPTLMTLDIEPLIEIFGFLDAMDILNTAQINITMYNKVDNIFGISEDGQSPPAPTPNPVPTNNNTTNVAPASAAAAAAGVVTSTPPTATANSTQKSSSGAVESSSSSSSAGVMGKGLFSMLQPKPAVTETSVSSTIPAKRYGDVKSSSSNATSSSASSGQQQQQQQPLNAKVAQSMASKLSDAELAAIISMTDKLSKLEKEVHMLRNEKEVFAAKLDGTEAVKQFLIGKVRDVEVKLNRSKEDEIKVTQQIASDQEVIAFLDSRVQEVEQQTENLTIEKTGTQANFDELKVSTSKKITMLSDMLKYEREKVREDEGEWKATKKVLVKEVKSCRAQILALQAERDGFKEQNDMLKRAIVSTGGGGGNGSKHNGGRKSSRSPTRRKNT